MEYITLTDEVVRQFLIKNGKGPRSKDYEFVVAIYLQKYCEYQWRTPCVIVFKIKDKYAREIPESGFADIERITSILRKQLDEDTEIDVYIGKKDESSRRKKGIGFQLKRFGKTPNSGTDLLISFLNSMHNKYVKNDAVLMLILETGSEINMKEVVQSIKTENYPFKSIMFIGMGNNTLRIGEMWPNQGVDEFPLP